MNVRIICHDTEAPGTIAELAHGRTRDTFGRFGHWVHGVCIRLADLNGPRGGGDDKSVALELSFERGAPLRFEARADTYERALANALNRAKRTILSSPMFGSRRPLRRAAGAGSAGA